MVAGGSLLPAPWQHRHRTPHAVRLAVWVVPFGRLHQRQGTVQPLPKVGAQYPAGVLQPRPSGLCKLAIIGQPYVQKCIERHSIMLPRRASLWHARCRLDRLPPSRHGVVRVSDRDRDGDQPGELGHRDRPLREGCKRVGRSATRSAGSGGAERRDRYHRSAGSRLWRGLLLLLLLRLLLLGLTRVVPDSLLAEARLVRRLAAGPGAEYTLTLHTGALRRAQPEACFDLALPAFVLVLLDPLDIPVELLGPDLGVGNPLSVDPSLAAPRSE